MTVNGQSAVVRVDGLSRRYGPPRALDGVDLALDRGITGLLGPNGAGKTTLLTVLATVNEPDAGQVSVFGLDPRDTAERVEIRRRLGYLPQELGYHRHFTVAAFLDYVAILKEIFDKRRRAEEVARVLAAVGLQRSAGKRIRTLSGGQRQRLGIAQALLGQPDLLILDEPTAGLDPAQRLRFRELLSDLPGEPVIVLSTHQADDVAAICPRVVVLLPGRVRFAGSPAELADMAAGRVWTADDRDGGAYLSWRGGDGRWRHIGDHPRRASRWSRRRSRTATCCCARPPAPVSPAGSRPAGAPRAGSTRRRPSARSLPACRAARRLRTMLAWPGSRRRY